MIWLLLLAGVLYTTNLGLTPLFGDEALYCDLGLKIADRGLYSTWDQIVNYWKVAPLTSIIQSWFIKSFPGFSVIEACRFSSVAATLMTGLVLGWLTMMVTGKKHIGLVATAIWLFNPFTLFTGRTALQEPWLAALLVLTAGLWLRNNLLSMLVLSLAFYTKLNALLIVPGLMLVTLSNYKKVNRKKILIRILILILTSLVLIAFSKNTTALWETVGYHTVSSRKVLLILKRAINNFRLLASWYIQYLSWGFVIVASLGSWLAVKKRFVWVFVPSLMLVAYLILVVGFFPRYLLMTMPFWSLIMALAWKARWGKLLVLGLLFTFFIRDNNIIFNPAQAQIAKEDRFQFFDDWSSGIGSRALVDFLENKNQINKLLLPEDLAQRVGLYLDESSLGTKLMLKPVNIQGKQKDFGDIEYAATTTHHQRFNKELGDRYNLELIYTTHGIESKSVLIYRLFAN